MLRITELDGVPPDAERLFEQLCPWPCRFLLDSSLEGPRGRYSILGSDPFVLLTARGRQVRLETPEGAERLHGDPFAILRDLLRRFRLPASPPPGIPFVGGAVGYLAYELGRHFERLPSSGEDDLGLPEMALGFYDRVTVIDRWTGRVVRVECEVPGVRPGNRPRLHIEPLSQVSTTPTGSNFAREDYIEAVCRVREYIVEGDIFQANIAQRFTTSVRDEPWLLYRHLRRRNPAPFSAFLDFGGFQVLSSSPERFLRVDGRRVETRPIKGTSRRSDDPAEDARLAAALRHSEKDLAELAMIVDLERNDLGRVCEYGTIEVAEPRVLESYASVHHLVASIVGELRTDQDLVDLLRATFPGGSITGAPKIRAMEIIDEVEPNLRSVYSGSIGYLGLDGRADLNIAIRTLTQIGDRAFFHVGGGIVADSDPAAEHQETLDKGRAIFAALDDFEAAGA